MAMTDAELQEAARRAVERGRMRLAARDAAFVAPLAAISLLGCGSPAATCGFAGVLAAVVFYATWRGQALGRAVWPGLLAGLAPFALPLLFRATGHLCIGGGCWLLPIAALAGGALAGMVLGWFLARLEVVSLFGALTICGLTGSLGCVLVGVGGVAGMAIGLAAGAAPVVLARRLA